MRRDSALLPSYLSCSRRPPAARTATSPSIRAARRTSSRTFFDQFEEETGIKLDVRYGDSAELAATIAEEGETHRPTSSSPRTPARSGRSRRGPPRRAPPRRRSPRSTSASPIRRGTGWGPRTRTRGRLQHGGPVRGGAARLDLGLRRPRSGAAGSASLPTNASFQAMVTAMRLEAGDERTREWLEAIAANEPRIFENNVATLEAIAAGEIDAGLRQPLLPLRPARGGARRRRSPTTTSTPATRGARERRRRLRSCDDRPARDGAAARRLPARARGRSTSPRRPTSTRSSPAWSPEASFRR